MFSKLSIAWVSLLASSSCLISCLLLPLWAASWALLLLETCFCFFPSPTPEPTHSFSSSDLYPYFLFPDFCFCLHAQICLPQLLYCSLFIYLHIVFPLSEFASASAPHICNPHLTLDLCAQLSSLLSFLSCPSVLHTVTST